MIEIMPNQVENLGFCRNMSINADVRILPLTPPLPHVRKCPLLVDPPPPSAADVLYVWPLSDRVRYERIMSAL